MKIIPAFLCLSVFLFLNTPSFATQLTPEETILELAESAKKSDWEKVYACFSKETAQGIEIRIKGYMSMVISQAKTNPQSFKNNATARQILALEKLSGKDFFVKLMQVNPESKKILGDLETYQVIKKRQAGEKVILSVKANSRTEEIPMIQENGQWKIDLTEELNPGVSHSQKIK